MYHIFIMRYCLDFCNGRGGEIQRKYSPLPSGAGERMR